MYFIVSKEHAEELKKTKKERSGYVIIDGKIYGEIILGKAKKEEERQREEKLNSWLSEIGW